MRHDIRQSHPQKQRMNLEDGIPQEGIPQEVIL